jgi:hypothetical protein
MFWVLLLATKLVVSFYVEVLFDQCLHFFYCTCASVYSGGIYMKSLAFSSSSRSILCSNRRIDCTRVRQFNNSLDASWDLQSLLHGVYLL